MSTRRVCSNKSPRLSQAEADAELKSPPLRYQDQTRAPHLPARKMLEGYSRTILAGSLTPEQKAGAVVRVDFQRALAPISNTSYNNISVTYGKQRFQPGMDPPDPPVAATPDQPACSHLAQAADALRRGDQEFTLRSPIKRKDTRRFSVDQAGDRVVERRGDRLSRRRGRRGHRCGDPRGVR